jgi:hypothetical protein
VDRIFFAAGVVCVIGGVLLARLEAQDPQTPPDNAAVASPADTPLTLGEQYLFSANKIFSGESMLVYAARAGLDQLRDRPAQWGSGADSYAVRYASFFGRSFVRQNIALGIRALDHEDPRYFPLERGSGWARTKYALARTFLVRNGSGGLMPAYSLFASAFATPLLADRWRPEVFHAGQPLRVGFLGIGLASASDLWQEFWPDLMRKLDLDGRLHRFHESH